MIAINADAAERRDPAVAACSAAMPGDDMNLLSLPWWCLPAALFVLSLAAVMGVNRWRLACPQDIPRCTRQ